MPVSRLKELLDVTHIHYSSIYHSPAFSAQGTAALTHVPGKEMAKCVMVLIDGALGMVVLPASRHVNLSAVRDVAGAYAVRLAEEYEFKNAFPDCEVGAMPPFGNLYHVTVYVDSSLADDREIVFNAGSHDESIRMKFQDFFELVKPVIGKFKREVPTAA